MRFVWWLSIALAGTALQSASAAPSAFPGPASIRTGADRLLATTAATSGPGIAVLIARGDAVIYRAARGSADIELGVPLKPDQVFDIASVTKMFTAATILKLAEQGKLSLDDPLARFLPDFPGEPATLRQLLSHTGGVSDKVPPADIQPGALRRDVDMATSVALIAKRPRDFTAGSDGAGADAPLQMTASGELHFVPDELAYFKPVRDAEGGVIRLDDFEHGDGPPKPLPRLPRATRDPSTQAKGS